MIKNAGINLHFFKEPVVGNRYSDNTTEAKPNAGKHNVPASSPEQAFAAQRATERSMADGLRTKFAASNGLRSAPQKASVPEHSGRPSVMESLLNKCGITKTHKWSPKNQFVISSASDNVIKMGAKAHATERKISKENIFSIASLSKDSLASIDLTGRLTLHGHGDTGYFEEFSPQQLAAKLANAGLKEVGVLKFKACDIGKGNYLEELKTALDRRGIKVGYFSAPVGKHMDARFPITIGNKTFNISPFPLTPQLVTKKSLLFLRPEKFGLKTIKGNVDVSFKGTRYDIPSFPNTSEARKSSKVFPEHQVPHAAQAVNSEKLKTLPPEEFAKYAELVTNNVQKRTALELEKKHLPLIAKMENKRNPGLNLRVFDNAQSCHKHIANMQSHVNVSGNFRFIYPPNPKMPDFHIALDVQLEPGKPASITAFDNVMPGSGIPTDKLKETLRSQIKNSTIWFESDQEHRHLTLTGGDNFGDSMMISLDKALKSFRPDDAQRSTSINSFRLRTIKGVQDYLSQNKKS